MDGFVTKEITGTDKTDSPAVEDTTMAMIINMLVDNLVVINTCSNFWTANQTEKKHAKLCFGAMAWKSLGTPGLSYERTKQTARHMQSVTTPYLVLLRSVLKFQCLGQVGRKSISPLSPSNLYFAPSTVNTGTGGLLPDAHTHTEEGSPYQKNFKFWKKLQLLVRIQTHKSLWNKSISTRLWLIVNPCQPSKQSLEANEVGSLMVVLMASQFLIRMGFFL